MRLRAEFNATVLLSLAAASRLNPQQISRPSESELAAITQRGRELAAYDRAVWHATDAVQMANPKTAQGQHSLAYFENGRWTVVFGSLSRDKTKFLINYEATQGEKLQSFGVKLDDPPREDIDFCLFGARALEMALADFGATSRPYNTAILPAADHRLYVYLYPAQLKANSYPLGGDVRYLISGDGKQILEKRQLHKTIIETNPAKGKRAAAGFHTHGLNDIAEDSDVLHVLQQDPPVPEMVGTAHFVYEIAADGTVRIKQEKRR
jgi:hypothetical protein